MPRRDAGAHPRRWRALRRDARAEARPLQSQGLRLDARRPRIRRAPLATHTGEMNMRPISAFRAVGALGCALVLASVTACFDDEPVAPARTGASTVVVTKPGVTSPQPTVVQQTPAPAPQSAPPIINNVVQPSAAAPAPAPAPAPATPAPGTTVNVQPRTVTVP